MAIDHGSPPERHFHADNAAAGFTVLLPLTDRDGKEGNRCTYCVMVMIVVCKVIGTQVVLPGTHILSIGDGSVTSIMNRLRTYCRRFMMCGGSIKVHEL